MSKVHCPRRYCGMMASVTTDGHGHDVLHCAGCDRNARGICRDCPAPITGRAHRCSPCNEKRETARGRRRSRVDRDHIIEQKREYNHRPEVRARRLAYGTDYRKDHPTTRDDIDRLYHREWGRRDRALKKKRRMEAAA